MEHRLATAFLFPSVYYTSTILVLHVHWTRFVGRFLILWIVSHLAPPPCLLSVCPYMGILCNSFDKGWHSILYSSCTLLPHVRRGSCAPGISNIRAEPEIAAWDEAKGWYCWYTPRSNVIFIPNMYINVTWHHNSFQFTTWLRMLRLIQFIMNIVIGLISALWSHYFDNTLPPRCIWRRLWCGCNYSIHKDQNSGI